MIAKTRALFRVVHHDAGQKIVWIVDLDGPLSVTNDAEAVVAQLLHDSLYPGHRIIYRDTMGSWDELSHQHGIFTGFTPARDMLPPNHKEL